MYDAFVSIEIHKIKLYYYYAILTSYLTPVYSTRWSKKAPEAYMPYVTSAYIRLLTINHKNFPLYNIV